jgi:hypothetical protein
LFFNDIEFKILQLQVAQEAGLISSVDVFDSKILIIQNTTDADKGEMRMEKEIDLAKFYTETRVFTNNIHVLTDRLEYRQTADKEVVPTKSTHIHYSELPSEIRYQITETATYLSYVVIDKEGQIIGYENDDIEIVPTPPIEPYNPTDITIQIVPNPASDKITVLFPMDITEMTYVKIMDITGNVYYTDHLFITGNSLSINIHALHSGIFYVVCMNDNGTACAKFIKQ